MKNIQLISQICDHTVVHVLNINFIPNPTNNNGGIAKPKGNINPYHYIIKTILLSMMIPKLKLYK